MEVEPMTLLIRVVASHPHAGRPEQDDEMKWAQLPALLLRLSAGPPRTTPQPPPRRPIFQSCNTQI